jgi:hypothetical protein
MRLAIVVALILGALAIAAPAGANNVPLTGSPLGGLLECVATPCASEFPATEPFFVRGGFAGEPRADLVNPLHRVELTVDGKRVHGITDLDLVGDPDSKWYVFNFSHGMTGVHTFVGCWFGTDGAQLFCGTRTVTFV